MAYQTILTEVHGKVGLIRLNRPPLNPLNSQIVAEIGQALDVLEADEAIGCIVITVGQVLRRRRRHQGDAGEDLHAKPTRTISSAAGTAGAMPQADHRRGRRASRSAAAAKLAMMCDFIIAADTAKFGQPEIKLGVMPGRRRHAAPDALRRQGQGHGHVPDRPHDGRGGSRARGLVSRVVSGGEPDRTRRMKSAATIAEMSRADPHDDEGKRQPCLRNDLAEGIRFERRVFHPMFATADQKEGMAAFVEKRKPNFRGA